MQCIDRYEKYKDNDFDNIILLIRNGTIKCGRYSHLVKIKDTKSMENRKYFK